MRATGTCDDRVRKSCSGIIQARGAHRMSELVARSNELLRAAYRSGGLLECSRKIVFPPAGLVEPAALVWRMARHACSTG